MFIVVYILVVYILNNKKERAFKSYEELQLEFTHSRTFSWPIIANLNKRKKCNI